MSSLSGVGSATFLTGRTAVVTGANSGIGLTVARRLVEGGARVVGTDLNRGEGLVELESAGAEVVTGDIASADDRRELIEVAGGVDFLVNSAGVIRLLPVEKVTEADWDLVMGINARATFFLSQELIPALNDGGSVVNLSSMAARRAVNVETAVYAASKAAIASMTRSFAYALAARNVRVNCVLPGLIDTPMQRQVVRDTAAARGADSSALGKDRTAEIPMARMGVADDVAETIMWLLSPASSYMTGQSIAIDGGLTMY